MKSIDGHHFLISLHQLSEDLKQISQIKANSAFVIKKRNKNKQKRK